MKTLTARETEAVTLLMQGHSHASAAKVMRVSFRTVRFHLDNAKAKTGACTLPQLVAKFMFANVLTDLAKET